MPVLVATAASALANSFLTVAEANAIARNRLYTTGWDAAASTPDAEDAVVSGGGASEDDTSAGITGSGTWSVGTIFKFGSHDTEYTVTTALTGSGSLAFSPALVQDVEDDDTVLRLTASTREKALIWASHLLDASFEWYGARRTIDQRLSWPRSGVTTPDGSFLDYDTIPELLRWATFDMAQSLLADDRTQVPDILGQGLKRAKIGPMYMETDTLAVKDIIPQSVVLQLMSLGAVVPGAMRGTRIMRVQRS